MAALGTDDWPFQLGTILFKVNVLDVTCPRASALIVSTVLVSKARQAPAGSKKAHHSCIATRSHPGKMDGISEIKLFPCNRIKQAYLIDSNRMYRIELNDFRHFLPALKWLQLLKRWFDFWCFIVSLTITAPPKANVQHCWVGKPPHTNEAWQDHGGRHVVIPEPACLLPWRRWREPAMQLWNEVMLCQFTFVTPTAPRAKGKWRTGRNPSNFIIYILFSLFSCFPFLSRLQLLYIHINTATCHLHPKWL